MIIGIGINGPYVRKVFEQVKERPLYVVDRTLESEQAEERELAR